MGSRRQTIFCGEPLISGTIGNKVLGRLSHPSETPRLWPLKAGVGGEPRAALTAVGRSPLSGILLHTIESSSKCVHFWKHVGPEAESWRRPSLPVTQRSEGSKAFWHVRLKKIIQPEMERKRKAKRSHPYRASKMKTMLLRNQQQASGCGNRRPALHWREGAAGDGQVPGQWARRALPEVSEQCSRSTPFSTLVIFIFSLPLGARWVISYTLKISRTQYIKLSNTGIFRKIFFKGKAMHNHLFKQSFIQWSHLLSICFMYHLPVVS